MANLFCLLNHTLTKEQEKDAIKNMGIKDIISPPEEIKYLWSNLSPKDELNILVLEKIINWIKNISHKNDYVLVQGEFGASFYIVDFCFRNSLIPVYATTKRKYNEIVLSDNSIERKHIFQHVQFRKYKHWELKNE